MLARSDRLSVASQWRDFLSRASLGLEVLWSLVRRKKVVEILIVFGYKWNRFQKNKLKCYSYSYSIQIDG